MTESDNYWHFHSLEDRFTPSNSQLLDTVLWWKHQVRITFDFGYTAWKKCYFYWYWMWKVKCFNKPRIFNCSICKHLVTHCLVTDVYKRQAHNRMDSATSGNLWRSFLKVKTGSGCKVKLYVFTDKKTLCSESLMKYLYLVK